MAPKALDNNVNIPVANTYTLEEVSKHHAVDDAWVVIENQVYNVTNFMKKHPGGLAIMLRGAGTDSTDAFQAFHKDRPKVDKYLRALKIGEVAPEDCEKESELVKDFRKLRTKYMSEGLFEPSRFFYAWNLLHIFGCEALAWFVLYHFGTGLLPFVVAGVLLCIAQNQAGWLQHDFGHFAVFKSNKWNLWAHWFIICHMKAASSTWWNRRHEMHHAHPNRLGVDPDVTLFGVFLLGKENAAKVGQAKKGALPYQYQHHWFWATASPLLLPAFFHLDNIRFVIKRGLWTEFAAMMSMAVKFYMIFYPVLGAWDTFKLYSLMRFLEAHWFVWVTQMSHISMNIDRTPRDWPTAQLMATCNVEQGVFNDWFTGHLNYQVEHHLFPTMPRHNYPKIAAEVTAMYKKHGQKLIVKPLGTAFMDILRAMEDYGNIWYEAYYEVEANKMH